MSYYQDLTNFKPDNWEKDEMQKEIKNEKESKKIGGKENKKENPHKRRAKK